MFTPEQALIIARTLAHIGLVLGIIAVCGLAVLIAEFLSEVSSAGRDIDDERDSE